jgi:NAD(P)H-quinone oxidoreductase subunit 4L
MTVATVLLVAAALIGIGVYGALSQQTFVMIMMGFEMIINGVMLAGVGFWSLTTGGNPKGQVLVIVAMLVMAIEAAIGFALVVNVYRARGVDTTEGLDTLRN